MEQRTKRKPLIYCNLFNTQYQIITKVVTNLNWRISYSEEDEESDLFWQDFAVTPERLTRMKQYQKINHFPGMHIISKKNYLAWSLNRMRKLLKQQFNFYPRTWVLPGDIKDLKIQFNNHRVFIVKPEALSQGKGIFLTKKLSNINWSQRVIVQQYIENPLLIENLKFDLRIYVLLISVEPLKIYIHQDGLARLATQDYNPPTATNLKQSCMHLTNYAVNKLNSKFVFNQDALQENRGHKRSLQSIYEILQNMGYSVENIQKEIDEIIVKTLISAQQSLAHTYRCCQPLEKGMCFEVLGFDIILDQQGKPWLLEVNHTPSFTTDTPLDQKIKFNVIKDTLVLLKVRSRNRKNYFAKKKSFHYKRKYKGKLMKIVKELPETERQQTQMGKIEEQEEFLGGFRRIYPVQSGKYIGIEEKAKILWNEWTRKKNPKSKKQVKKIQDPKPLRNKRVHCRYRTPSIQCLELPVIKEKKLSVSPPKISFNLDQVSLISSHLKRTIGNYLRGKFLEDFQSIQKSKILSYRFNIQTGSNHLVPGNYISPTLFQFNQKTHSHKRAISQFRNTKYSIVSRNDLE